MKKKVCAFVLLGVLVMGAALVSAQEVYAGTGAAYDIGFI